MRFLAFLANLKTPILCCISAEIDSITQLLLFPFEILLFVLCMDKVWSFFLYASIIYNKENKLDMLLIMFE